MNAARIKSTFARAAFRQVSSGRLGIQDNFKIKFAEDGRALVIMGVADLKGLQNFDKKLEMLEDLFAYCTDELYDCPPGMLSDRGIIIASMHFAIETAMQKRDALMGIVDIFLSKALVVSDYLLEPVRGVSFTDAQAALQTIWRGLGCEKAEQLNRKIGVSVFHRRVEIVRRQTHMDFMTEMFHLVDTACSDPNSALHKSIWTKPLVDFDPHCDTTIVLWRYMLHMCHQSRWEEMLYRIKREGLRFPLEFMWAMGNACTPTGIDPGEETFLNDEEMELPKVHRLHLIDINSTLVRTMLKQVNEEYARIKEVNKKVPLL